MSPPETLLETAGDVRALDLAPIGNCRIAALWGNIPQSYSMAGIINSAMRLSVRWEDVWCHVSS
jgi:hypothetical protein